MRNKRIRKERIANILWTRPVTAANTERFRDEVCSRLCWSADLLGGVICQDYTKFQGRSWQRPYFYEISGQCAFIGLCISYNVIFSTKSAKYKSKALNLGNENRFTIAHFRIMTSWSMLGAYKRFGRAYILSLPPRQSRMTDKPCN
jgi:hypothetical protein